MTPTRSLLDRALRGLLFAVLTLAAALGLVAGIGAPPAQAEDGAHAVGAVSDGLKPALRGLVVTQPASLKTVPYAEFGSLRIPWATLETSPGTFDFSPIDHVLVDHPDVKFRLRIMAGINAPTWVKSVSGGCVQIDPDSVNGNTGCAPRFWTDAFHKRYQGLMEALAGNYENDPQVVEVANSECTTIYSEPFILGGDTHSIDRLWRAGYTQAGHETCLRRSTSLMMNLFPTTRVSMAGHTKWQFIMQGSGGAGDGTFAASWEDERAMLNQLADAYGSRLVLEDHGLGPDDTVCPTPGESRTAATSWYCYLSGLHNSSAPYGWQFTLNGGSMVEAADAGVGMGACYLEFAAFQSLGDTKRRAVNDQLIANCQDTGYDPGDDLPVDVPKVDTRTTARLPRARTASHHPAIVVTVTAPNRTAVGHVVITSHGRRVGAGWLNDGRVRLHVDLARGPHRLVARYQGTHTLNPPGHQTCGWWSDAHRVADQAVSVWRYWRGVIPNQRRQDRLKVLCSA
jgi:hypothetical protein